MDTQERTREVHTRIRDVGVAQNAQDKLDTEKDKHLGQRSSRD